MQHKSTRVVAARRKPPQPSIPGVTTMTSQTYLALDALRIAIVDDNGYFRRITRVICNGFGVRQVLEAASVEEGWGLVSSNSADILLLDWKLGHEGGKTLLDRIRSHPDDRIATQTVIFVTAYSDKRHVIEAARLGANDFIVKPVSARMLYDRIRRLCSTRILYERRGGRLHPITAGRPERPGMAQTFPVVHRPKEPPRTAPGDLHFL